MRDVSCITELDILMLEQRNLIRACILSDNVAIQACLSNTQNDTEFYLDVRDFLRKYVPASERYLCDAIEQSIVRTIDLLKQ